jgi:hypothetical protein
MHWLMCKCNHMLAINSNSSLLLSSSPLTSAISAWPSNFSDKLQLCLIIRLSFSLVLTWMNPYTSILQQSTLFLSLSLKVYGWAGVQSQEKIYWQRRTSFLGLQVFVTEAFVALCQRLALNFQGYFFSCTCRLVVLEPNEISK